MHSLTVTTFAVMWFASDAPSYRIYKSVLLTSGSSASIWFSWMSSVVRKLNTTSCAHKHQHLLHTYRLVLTDQSSTFCAYTQSLANTLYVSHAHLSAWNSLASNSHPQPDLTHFRKLLKTCYVSLLLTCVTFGMQLCSVCNRLQNVPWRWWRRYVNI